MQENSWLTYVLAFCALVVMGLLIRREFFLEKQYVHQPVKQFSHTDTLDLGGIQVGPDNAPVTIIEFFDYECPFCKKFQGSVDAVLNDFKDNVKVRYVHFPLPNHSNATEAAYAAECASRQNSFTDTHKFLFDNQVRLDSIQWKNAAQSIGIPDGQAFMSCIEYQEPFLSVEKGITTANQLGINSIPTFLINGKMFQGAMSPDALENLIQRELE